MSTNFFPDIDDLITQAEAARLRGCSRQAITKLVQAGRLQSYTVAGRCLLSKKEVIGFEPHPAGRPKIERN